VVRERVPCRRTAVVERLQHGGPVGPTEP